MAPLFAAALKLIGTGTVRTIAKKLAEKFINVSRKEILKNISKAQTRKARDAIKDASKALTKDPKKDKVTVRSIKGQFTKDTKGKFSIKPEKRKTLGSRKVLGDKNKNKQRSMRTKYNPLKRDTKKDIATKALETTSKTKAKDPTGDLKKAKHLNILDRSIVQQRRQARLNKSKSKKNTSTGSASTGSTVTNVAKDSVKSKATRTSKVKDFIKKNPKKTAAGATIAAAGITYTVTRGKKKKNGTPVNKKSNGTSGSNNAHITKSASNRSNKYNYMGRLGGIRVGVRKKK